MMASGRWLVIVLALLYAGITTCYADTERGLDIAKTIRNQEHGFGNYAADMEMVLIDSSGKETLRRLRVKVLEVADDGDKSLAIFDTPADVKGVAFLSHTHIRQADDQWLYLPSLKRVKRIAPANKTAPFMGSEFSYEDFASSEVEKYTYKYAGEGTADSRPSYMLERHPVDENSGYSRQLVWVDKERYVELKIEYFDRKGEKLKTLVSRGFKQYLNRYWFPAEMQMQNHQSGKHSVLRWHDYQFRQKMSDQDFHPSSLTRMH